MKRNFLALLLFVGAMFFVVPKVYSQVNSVTLVVTGDGKTKQEATNNALRSAIEQTFGAFVSANTSVVNDEIVKDEIVTVSSGNIEKFEEIHYKDADSLKTITLKATVSVRRLTSYAQSKGMTCELAGALFVQNQRLKRLYEENEKKAIENAKKVLLEMASQNSVWSYSIGSIDTKVYNNGERDVYYPVFDVEERSKNFNLNILLGYVINTLTYLNTSEGTCRLEQSYHTLLEKDPTVPVYRCFYVLEAKTKGMKFRTNAPNELVKLFDYVIMRHCYRITDNLGNSRIFSDKSSAYNNSTGGHVWYSYTEERFEKLTEIKVEPLLLKDIDDILSSLEVEDRRGLNFRFAATADRGLWDAVPDKKFGFCWRRATYEEGEQIREKYSVDDFGLEFYPLFLIHE